jgi:ABC-2 type transport system permease protein
LKNVNPDTLDVVYVDSEDDGEKLVRDGKAYGPDNLSENLTSTLLKWRANPQTADNATIQIRLDKAIFNIAATVVSEFSAAMMKTIDDNGESLPLKLDTGNAIYSEGASFMDFFVPGVMGFASFLRRPCSPSSPSSRNEKIRRSKGS